MTEDRRDPRGGTSRRSLLRTGAVASGALVLGLSSVGAARDGNATGGTDGNRTGNRTDGNATGGGQDGPPPGDALLFNDEYRPGAQFRVISGVVSETPELTTDADEILGRYDAYIVEYLITDERVLLFASRDATVQQGQVYRLTERFGIVEREPTGEGIVAVGFRAVPDDEVVVESDFSIDDLETLPGGGKALVRADNLHVGALVQIVSGVVEWTPPPEVAGSDVLSEYNTRHAVYLNTDDEFLLYPAHSAEIREGEVYAIREEFDITDPEGNLVTVELDHVSDESIDESLLD